MNAFHMYRPVILHAAMAGRRSKIRWPSDTLKLSRIQHDAKQTIRQQQEGKFRRKEAREKCAQFPVDGESFFSAGPSADGRLPLG